MERQMKQLSHKGDSQNMFVDQYRIGKFQYFEKSIQRIFLKIKFAINFCVCSLRILLIHMTIMSSSLATAKQAILHNIAIAE